LVGTPRSSVSFFMSRFRECGLIDYDGGIRVRKALLNAILHDRLPGDNAAKPAIFDIPEKPSRLLKEPHPGIRFAT
jgi:hypothetical protein